jgi:hypothetical protein
VRCAARQFGSSSSGLSRPSRCEHDSASCRYARAEPSHYAARNGNTCPTPDRGADRRPHTGASASNSCADSLTSPDCPADSQSVWSTAEPLGLQLLR